jgi:Zn-dependent peptidase ImmA (M78 family)
MKNRIAALYEETDVAQPSEAYPIAPLGPILERLPIRFDELPQLTLHSAEEFLKKRNVLQEPLDYGDENPDASLSGFIYSDGYIARLLVNSSEMITRRRFSIAHELGHFVLHCRPQAAALANGEPFIDMFASEGEGHVQREQEADAFAATLLMPTEVVQAIVKTALQRGWRTEDLLAVA